MNTSRSWSNLLIINVPFFIILKKIRCAYNMMKTINSSIYHFSPLLPKHHNIIIICSKFTKINNNRRSCL